MLHHLHWQRESAIKVLFKKSNKYITNCNEFSLHVNKYALPCMYYLTYHISSLDSAQANATCVKPTKSPAASPHYIHDIYIFPTIL